MFNELFHNEEAKILIADVQSDLLQIPIVKINRTI